MDPESPRGLLSSLKTMLGRARNNSSAELEKEIQGLVDQGEAQGFISHHEADMIEAVFDLGETSAGQIMVPRTELAMLPADANIEETIKLIMDSGHSRIPIYGEDPDHILGVLHAKDLLPYWGSQDREIKLSSVYRKPFFVPQAMKVAELLAAFRRRQVHLAVVVDEYGGTAGVVTMEDVLEEIVGEIEDEYDQPEQRLVEQSDGSLLVDARLEVEELAEHLGVTLPEELPEGRFETVGGFITTLLGKVPDVKDEAAWGPLRMVVVDGDERRVSKVRVFFQPLPGESFPA